jgi:hypothetical protein
MEATEHLKRITKNLFEAKKFFDYKLTESIEEFESMDEDQMDSDEGQTKQEDIDTLDEIVESLDDVILKIKGSFDLEDLEESE